MADFRTHAAFGVGLGVLLAVMAGVFELSSVPSMLVLVFLAAALGAMAPDIDSDSGVPFHVTFGALSIVSAGFAYLSLFSRGYGTPESGFFALGVAVFIWAILGTLFKKWTKHRGMAHSLPAAVLAGLLVFFVAGRLSFGDADTFLLGVSATLGYVVHLILDELYAVVDFEGKRFVSSRSLGSALKLSSSSRFATVITYIAIILLTLSNASRLVSLARDLWNRIV
jgi:membrane-bound metal-dependent hydrolase YbcI (DUF457 family)